VKSETIMSYYSRATLAKMIESTYHIGVFRDVDSYLRHVILERATWLDQYDVRIIDVSASGDDMLRFKLKADPLPESVCAINPRDLILTIWLTIVKDEWMGRGLKKYINGNVYFITLDEMLHFEALLENERE